MPLSLTLSGCVSPEEVASANKIITALPTEVEGCTFLGDVDTAGSANIENARFFLKRDVAFSDGVAFINSASSRIFILNYLIKNFWKIYKFCSYSI